MIVPALGFEDVAGGEREFIPYPGKKRMGVVRSEAIVGPLPKIRRTGCYHRKRTILKRMFRFIAPQKRLIINDHLCLLLMKCIKLSALSAIIRQ